MGKRLPSFSIIVPTFRRPRQLVECVQALTGLDYPPERFQVIVVESSPSGAPDALKVFQKRIEIHVIPQAPCGQAAARNLGARSASGEFLAFTDDDCRPAANWLRALAAQFVLTPDRAVGGPVRNRLINDPYATVSQIVIDCLYEQYNSQPNLPRYFGTNNLAVPIEQFNTLGGFDRSYRPAGEDRDFCARWLEHGYQMAFVPEAIVWHAHGMNLADFWEQHFGYGRGSFLFRVARTRVRQGSLALEPPGFYWKMLSTPFSQIHRSNHPTWLLTALLLVSQAATAAGFARQALELPKAVGAKPPPSA
jgi:GT2 family glycosyltransferase